MALANTLRNHNTAQVNDHEGTLGVVLATVLYVYVVVTER